MIHKKQQLINKERDGKDEAARGSVWTAFLLRSGEEF